MTSLNDPITEPTDAARHPAGDADGYTPSPFDPVAPPADAGPVERFVKPPTRYADLKALTKPRITRMVVITTAIGFVFGVTAGGFPWGVFAVALMGAALSCMAASVFNQVYERDTDAMMQRTKQRPLAAGRVGVRSAMVLGTLLTLAGVGVLFIAGLYLAAGLCAFTIASYALVYTPLKRTTSLALLIGAVPGAMPPMIGYAAAAGDLGPAAWLLFAVMFVWQVPHFLAIAWLYREDYARAKLAMLPVIDPTGLRTFRQTLIGCMLLLPLGILPSAVGVAGKWSFFAALLCGLGFLAFGVLLVLRPTHVNARRLFLASLVYLPVVLTAMLIDRA